MYDALREFCGAIEHAGMQPPNAIEPGKIYRFPGVGKRPSNRAGWCLLFDDGLGGCFGDWSSGISETWQAKRSKPYSRAERAAFARRVAAARAETKAARKARQVSAANRAIAIWNAATPAPANHTYLVRKGIRPHGVRLHKNALTLPVVDFTGKLSSLQFIGTDGGKRLLSGGHKQGCFIPVSQTQNAHNTQNPVASGDSADCADIADRFPISSKPSRVIICEGWATGCTLAEDEPGARVLAAIDAGNLKPVALAVRLRRPSAEIVIAGDDDRLTAGNPGATKARAAAVAANAQLALPPWPENAPKTLTDFNDLAGWLAGGRA